MKWFVNGCKRMGNLLNGVSSVLLYSMMLLTVTDVVGRLFGHPVHQSYELSGIMGAMVIAFALPKTSLDRGNVAIDLLTAKMKSLPRKVLFILTRILNVALLIALTWFVFKKGYALAKTGAVYDVLQIETHYIIFVLAFAIFMLMLTFVADIFRGNEEEAQKQ